MHEKKETVQAHGEVKGKEVRLFLQMQEAGRIDCFKLKGELGAISNVPNMTRLFGTEIQNFNEPYYLFPIDLSVASSGEYKVLQENEKYLKVQFLSGLLSGIWILRRLNTGEVLLWKPADDNFVCPAKSMITPVVSSFAQPVVQQFSSFVASTDGKTFSGVAAATGVWTGLDMHTTMFPAYTIEKMYHKMIQNMGSLVVDFNHDLQNKGGIDKVTLHDDKKIKYISVEGHSDVEVPRGAGLSIMTVSDLRWDDNLKVFVADDSTPLGVSVITKGNPACTICRVN